ncbi:hypothetical protein [uncultured Winogradskyella sp.]|uniref:hypothetical protein n=1 Tax=uncultured Winogradskyella sp. TaxID=395353 RepID=UPI0035169A25
MKFKLSIIALSLSFFCKAQAISEDEMLHFAGGAVLSGATYAIVYGKTQNKSKAFWYSLAVPTLAGLTKEILDESAFGGYFDGREFASTVLGGLVVTLSFDLFTGNKKKKEKERLNALRYKSSHNFLSR